MFVCLLPGEGPEIGLAITRFLLLRMMVLEELTGGEEDAYSAHSRALDELCGCGSDGSDEELSLQAG